MHTSVFSEERNECTFKFARANSPVTFARANSSVTPPHTVPTHGTHGTHTHTIR